MDIIASSLALFYIFNYDQLVRPMITPWLNVMIYGRINDTPRDIPQQTSMTVNRDYRSDSTDWTLVNSDDDSEDDFGSERSEFIMEEINI